MEKKRREIQKSNTEEKKSTIEQRNIIWVEDEEEGPSSLLMPMYILDSDQEDSYIPSHQSPTVIVHDAPLPMHLEEVHSSPFMENIPSERHSMIQEEENP